jgi:hypothetical protein
VRTDPTPTPTLPPLPAAPTEQAPADSLASVAPPEPGLGRARAVWRQPASRWAHDSLQILAVWTILVGLWWWNHRDAGWGFLAFFAAVCGLQMLFVRRPRLAAGKDWLQAGRHWVRLDQLCRVTAEHRTLTLVDTGRRAVHVDVGDLTANRQLARLVKHAIERGIKRGQLSLGPITRGLLGLPLQRRRGPRRDRAVQQPKPRPGWRRPKPPRPGLRSSLRPVPAWVWLLAGWEVVKVAVGVLILVGAPVLCTWRAWLVITHTSLPQAEAEGWYVAGLIAGALGAIAYYRLHERVEGPSGRRRRSRRVTQRHPDLVDEANTDYSINGACQSRGPRPGQSPVVNEPFPVSRQIRC